jgi:hypothetical protein
MTFDRHHYDPHYDTMRSREAARVAQDYLELTCTVRAKYVRRLQSAGKVWRRYVSIAAIPGMICIGSSLLSRLASEGKQWMLSTLLGAGNWLRDSKEHARVCDSAGRSFLWQLSVPAMDDSQVGGSSVEGSEY